MSIPTDAEPKRVLKYFEEISAVPRGSGNMKKISDYCVAFAEKHSLKYVRDAADNVIIYKNATVGYEYSEPIVLQGHLDIVCQRESNYETDFLNDGIKIYADGDFIKARGTTLGADNGIAVAMILAVLESDRYPHPALEAVFTTDEEIGMLGASQLDMSLLSARKIINLDAEEDGILTVSCAGGCNFRAEARCETKSTSGTAVTVYLKGLRGGHSGVEINSGRVNANILAGRFLNHMRTVTDYGLVTLSGGDKSNAIANECKIVAVTSSPELFKNEAVKYLNLISEEISAREPDFSPEAAVGEVGSYKTLTEALRDKIIYILLCAPNGVIEMSAEIEGLPETSLNLGITEITSEKAVFEFALRSNKASALEFLEQRLGVFFANSDCHTETAGYYPPWEFNPDSSLRPIYADAYKRLFGTEPKIEAIHAGLECGIFSAARQNTDCIAFGPQLYDVHTVNECLSISSAERTFKLLLEILKCCK